MATVWIDDVIPPFLGQHHGPSLRVARLDIGHRLKVELSGAPVAR
jgi:hypothetical protein